MDFIRKSDLFEVVFVLGLAFRFLFIFSFNAELFYFTCIDVVEIVTKFVSLLKFIYELFL